jgi:hypothetical protein
LTKNLGFAALLVPVAAVLAGCASSFHGSYLVGERWFKTNIDTQPVIILSVDGRDTTMRRVLVDPGLREIRVQAPPVPGAPQETATLQVDVKPCFTYYIVAVRENRLSAAFTPRVDYAQPLAGCTPPPEKN